MPVQLSEVGPKHCKNISNLCMQADVNYHSDVKLLVFFNPIQIRWVLIFFQLNTLFATGSGNILPGLDYKILLPVGITIHIVVVNNLLQVIT